MKSCNRFSVLSTFKFYIEISRDQISKLQKGALWAVTDDRFCSTRDVHYGTFREVPEYSGIFISNPEYRILFQNNLLGAK